MSCEKDRYHTFALQPTGWRIEMTKVVNNTCAKCGVPIGALVRTCGETKGDPRTEGVCLKESKS